MKTTQRKPKSKNLLTKFWNEFLFARQFEYETPLTPDEVTTALSELEEQEHKQYFFTMSPLKHRVTYNRATDKSGEFEIELESSTRNQWWDIDSALIDISGSVTADNTTGMTTIKGQTQFNRNYYLWMLVLFVPNFLLQLNDSSVALQILWITIIVLYWYTMYYERNKLANRFDNIIMNAKSQKSTHQLEEQKQEEVDYSQLMVEERGYLNN